MMVSKLHRYCDSTNWITVTLKLNKYNVKGHLQVQQCSVTFKFQQSAPHSTGAPNVEDPIAIETAITQAKVQVDQLQPPSSSWDVLLGKVNWFMTFVGPITGVNLAEYIKHQFSLLLASCILIQRWHGIS
jgi:hypothetical protein